MSRLLIRIADTVRRRTRGFQDHARRAGIRLEIGLHPAIRRYLRFSRELWKDRPRAEGDAVVLVGLFDWYPSLHSYAYVTNYLARRHRATIEWFYFFPGRAWLCEKLFASFGARPGLCLDSIEIDENRARQLAAEIFAGLKTKWDVVRIRVDGVVIGDLIYDTYLRNGPAATVEIADPRLEAIIHRAVRLLFACRGYLAQRKVVALIPDHLVYIHCGMMVRAAFLARIPMYHVFYGVDFYLLRVEGNPEDCQIPMYRPYALYPRLFAALPPAEQERGREQGRQALRDRFAGKVDGVLMLPDPRTGAPVVKSAYAVGSGETLFEDTDRPRILVLLHDLCDAVHVFRDMLFPDFYEWIHFLLARASETDFDWYVKPHPNVARGGVLGAANQRVLTELKTKYPRIRFLEPTASSAQIVQEGVRAMFTVYGTAGHEFAYLGIPVVNAGDNPHIGYTFNLHPRSLAEYESCIANAASLKTDIRKDEIEEYVYMNYFHCSQRIRSAGNPMRPGFFASEDFQNHLSRPETLDLLAQPLTGDERGKLDEYFDAYFHAETPAGDGQHAGTR